MSFILILWRSLCSDVLLCRTSWQQRTVCATAWMALRFTLASRRWSGCLTPTDLAESVRADLLLVCNWCIHCAHSYLPLHTSQRERLEKVLEKIIIAKASIHVFLFYKKTPIFLFWNDQHLTFFLQFYFHLPINSG